MFQKSFFGDRGHGETRTRVKIWGVEKMTESMPGGYVCHASAWDYVS